MSEGTAPVLMGLLQLSRRVREVGTLQELGFVAVNETRGLLNYRQAVLWVDGSGGHLQSLSGVARPDPGAPFAQWLARVFRAVMPVSAARRLQADELSALLAEEWAEWLPACALLVPLQHPQLGGEAVLLLVRDEPWQDAELTLAAELGAVYGYALYAQRPARRPLTWLRQWFQPRRTRWRVALALLLVAVFPIRLSTLAPAEVTAVRPAVMRAPLDGIVDRLDVRPNQVVDAGAPLFSLDTTTLRGQYAGASKAVEAAQEQYRQAAQLAVTDDKSRLEMTRKLGELRQHQVELQHATEMLDRIQVKAPNAGVAVFDNIDEWTGKAVVAGEKVLMLADPDSVELTAFMPAADQITLQPGAKVSFYPKGAPFSSYQATVQSVAYRAATTEEGVLAYQVKATLMPDQALPRLGLSGSARLHAGRVPLIYYVLRRPLVAARQWLGW